MLNNKRNSSLKINKSIYFLAFLVILSLILPSAFSEAFSSVPTTEKIDKSADVPNAGIKAAENFADFFKDNKMKPSAAGSAEYVPRIPG